MDKPRILFLDLETAPLLGYVWSLWKQNVGLNQIAREWSILSYCAKWHGDEAVIYEDTRREKKPENDRRLVRSLHRLLDEADIVVAQNGIRFDVKKVNARFVLLGLPPPSPFRVVDTMVEARRHFGFTSSKLEWMTDKLCTTHRKKRHEKFPGFELWRECLAGNPDAWHEMEEYNRADVLSLEELYFVLRPWMSGHPNVGNYDPEPGDGPKCPHCGSPRVRRKGLRYTQVGQYPRWHCQACGAWSRGRLTVNSPEHKANLLIS